MNVEFFFYYEPGHFPGSIIDNAFVVNPNFEAETYFLNHESPGYISSSAKWTLKIIYGQLTEPEIETLLGVFQGFDEYDGFGFDNDDDYDDDESHESENSTGG